MLERGDFRAEIVTAVRERPRLYRLALPLLLDMLQALRRLLAEAAEDRHRHQPQQRLAHAGADEGVEVLMLGEVGPAPGELDEGGDGDGHHADEAAMERGGQENRDPERVGLRLRQLEREHVEPVGNIEDGEERQDLQHLPCPQPCPADSVFCRRYREIVVLYDTHLQPPDLPIFYHRAPAPH